jgi:hypothetical protein
MRVSIRDRESLLAIPPLEVVAYLRAGGWNQEKYHAGKYGVWTRQDGDGQSYEIAIPLSNESPDFIQRVAEALATLESIEKRGQQEIYRDLQTTSSDVIRLRIGNGELASGDIPFEEGAQVIERAKELLVSAACAAVQPKKVIPKRKPDQALEYMRKLRLGQTERGSYVVTIHSRVPPQLGQIDFAAPEPYERKVTSVLGQSLVAAKSAAESATASGTLKAFEDAIPLGVSANFCESLAGLCDFGEIRRRLEVGLTWARSRPATATAPSAVTFSPDCVQVFSEVARVFKDTTPQEDFQLFGPVIELKRLESAQNGRVTVLGIVGEKPLRIVMEFGDSDYQLATKAHSERLPVRCSGILVRDGKSYSLRNPTNLSLAESGES